LQGFPAVAPHLTHTFAASNGIAKAILKFGMKTILFAWLALLLTVFPFLIPTLTSI